MDKSCPAATELAIDSVSGRSLAEMSSPRHGVGNTTVQSASRAKDGSYSTFSETNSNQSSWNVSLNLANDEYLYGIKVHCKSDCSKLRRAHILFSDVDLSGKNLVAAKAHSKQEYSFYVKPAINDYWCATLPSPVKAKYLSIRYDDSYNEPVLKLAEVQPYVYSLSTPPNDAPPQFSDPIVEVVTEHNNTIKDALNDAAITVVAVGVGGTATYVGQTALRNYLVAGRTASSIANYIRDAEGETHWVGQSNSAMEATSGYSGAPQTELMPLTGTSARTSMSYLTYSSNATTGATIITDSYTAGSGTSFVAPTITASCAVACTLMVYGDEVDTSTAGTYRQLYVVVDDNGDASEAIHGLYVVNPLGSGQGTITREVWEGISGNSVQDLLDSPNYPNSPNMTEELDQFAAPINVNNDYGTRIHGYLKVPMEGDYTFWIASDDKSQVLLRDDSQSPSVTTIASFVSNWTNPFDWNDSDITSFTLTLQAGSYYIYALHKEGGGGDNLAVAWQGPWQVMPTVIDGEYLSPYGAPEQQSATIQGKTGNAVTHSWSSVVYTDTLPDNEVPVLFAQMQTYDGPDTAGVRMSSVSATGFIVMVEEEKSSDEEISHTTEVIGYAGFEAGPIVDIYGNTIGEAGTVTMNQGRKASEYTLSFSRQYNHPVVFMHMNTYNGADPTHMRILSVIGNSARYKQEEWDYRDGAHTTETISYLVLEKGPLLGRKIYRLADGTRLLVGATEVNASWQTVGNMLPDMADIVVLSQPQTVNDASSVVTRMKVRADEFDLRLQKQENVGGSKSTVHAHGTETVAYIAIDRVDPGMSEVLNFNDYNLSAYAGTQDKPSSGAVTVEDGGLTISINGNRWQNISFPYTITKDTVLEFDFESTAQGEVQGIGFDTDNKAENSNRIFNIYGSQPWGIRTYRYDGNGNKEHFSIPVGQHFTGSCFKWLVFAHDDDERPFGNAKISNIHINGGLKEANCQYAKLTQPNHGFTIQTPDLGPNYIDIGNEWSVAATVTNINTSEARTRALFRGADADIQLAIDESGILGLNKTGIGFVRVNTNYNAVSAINDNQPHTIAAVCDGIDTFFFVDGVYVGVVAGQYIEGGVATTDSTLINSTISRIGSMNNVGRFAERLDNIQIHNRALRADETVRLAQGETISAGLVAHYTFDGVFPYEDKTDEYYNLVPASGVVLESYPQ
jgi:hypothetical protein